MNRVNLFGDRTEDRPRTSPDRAVGKIIGRREAESGIVLEAPGSLWSDSQTDRMLDGWFAGWPIYNRDPSIPSFHSMCRRSEHSIWSRLWELSVNHRFVRGYQPTVKREDRTGAPVTDRDLFFVERSVSDTGIANGADTHEHLAKVLGRSIENVRRICEQLIRGAVGPNPNGLLPVPYHRETERQRNVRLIRQVVRGSTSQAKSEFFGKKKEGKVRCRSTCKTSCTRSRASRRA